MVAQAADRTLGYVDPYGQDVSIAHCKTDWHGPYIAAPPVPWVTVSGGYHTLPVQRTFPFLPLLLLIGACRSPSGYVLEVKGTESLRPVAVVSIELPLRARAATWEARADDGTTYPVQTDPGGQSSMILDRLGAGEVRRLTLVRAEPRQGVVVTKHAGLVSLSTDEGPVTAYHESKQPLPREDIDPIFHRSGYLHPVYTPTGLMVTDDYPPDHLHHHGIWSAWTRTAFQGRNPDFWNMGNRTGLVEHMGLDTLWEGPVHGGLRARLQQVDLTGATPTTVLNETWQVRVYNTDALHLFDVTVTQELAGDSIVHLLEHHYGGLGLRGARGWTGPVNTRFLTSEGRTRLDGHATRARWCHVGGMVAGEMVGIAVLGHPENYESPQPMRIHPDEPFFNFAPAQAGAFAIRPGEKYEMRYRFVVYDGDPDPDLLDALWEDFAYPLQGTITSGT